jgi:hypothetical protein
MILRHPLLGFVLAAPVWEVTGVKHHLYVGNLSPPASLHALEFDDESLDFRVTHTINADAPHAWITFNVCS